MGGEEEGGRGRRRKRKTQLHHKCMFAYLMFLLPHTLPVFTLSHLTHTSLTHSPPHTLPSLTHLLTPLPISHSPLHTPSNSHPPSLRTSSLILRHLNLRRQS